MKDASPKKLRRDATVFTQKQHSKSRSVKSQWQDFKCLFILGKFLQLKVILEEIDTILQLAEHQD